MKSTEHYQLNIPELYELYDVEVFNENAEKLDGIIKAQEDQGNAVQAALDTHSNDGTRHITAAERTSWNGAASSVNAHMANLVAHVNNISSHVSAADRSNWNGKQNNLGYVPVSSYGNRANVHMGWDGGNLVAQVDTTHMGAIVTTGRPQNFARSLDGVAQNLYYTNIPGLGTSHFVVFQGNRGDLATEVGLSDQRLKTDIEDSAVDGIDFIKGIRHRQFRWKDDETNTLVEIGYIAQEIGERGNGVAYEIPQHPYLPEEGNSGDDAEKAMGGEYLESIFQISEYAVLCRTTKALQELIGIVEGQQERIEALESQIQSMEGA